MKKEIKESIPISHYEMATEVVDRLVGFESFVEKMVGACGTEPDFKTFSEHLYDFIPSVGSTKAEQCLQANIMFHLFNTHVAGIPIYYITPQLSVDLAKTDLNVDMEFLLSPYREVHFQIDPGLFTVRDKEKDYPVTGFYVFYQKHDAGTELRIMATSFSKKEELFDLQFYFRLFLPAGKFKQGLNKYLSEVIQNENHGEFGGGENVEYVEEFASFVLNTLLYLTSKNPDILAKMPVDLDKEIAQMKSPGKIKKLIKRASSLTKLPVLVLGPRVFKDEKEISQIRDSGGVGSWKLKYQVKVSAHWRVQWYGSSKDGNRRSELIRIDSYTKGPDAAELLHKKRIVI